MSRTFRFLPLVVCGGAAVLLALVLALWMPRGVHALWVGESLADGGVLATGQVHLEITGEVSVEVDGEAIGSGAAICVTDTVTIAVPLSVQATGTSAVPALDRTSQTAAPGTVSDVDLDDINAALRSSPEPQLHLLHLEVTSAQAGTVRVDEVLSLSAARGAGWVSTAHVEIDLLFDSCGPILATSWDTTTTTDPVIFVFGAGSEGTIDWGDGSPLEAVREGTQTHQYSEDGTWDVTVTGIIPSVRFNGSDALVSVNRWDEATRTTSLLSAFQGADNLVYVTAPPTTVTNMSHAFRDTTANPTLDGWDTSNVTNMSYMFRDARAFNGDLSRWDTSSVRNMSYMFHTASVFNGDLSRWDTSNVTTMSNMFASAQAFNSDLSRWDTSNVTTMSNMFASAQAFNSDLSRWDTSNVTSMASMFYGASVFNGDLSRWDTSNVTSMASMFYGASVFNGDLSRWDTSNVTSMSYMFYFASVFNSDLSRWDTSNVTSMSYMFYGASAFNSDLSRWDTSKVTTMSSMFRTASAFTGDLRPWNVLLIPQEPTNFRLDANPAMQSPIWGTEGMPVRSGAAGDDTPQADDTPVADDTRDEFESATDSPEIEAVDNPAETEAVDNPAEAEPGDDPATGDAAPAQEPANPQQTDMLCPREETYEPSPIRAFLLAPSQES